MANRTARVRHQRSDTCDADHHVNGTPLRATVAGKFLQLGPERFWVKGVSYGTFAPDADGHHFPPPARIAEDFELMRRAGVNTVRTYTVPDQRFLDLAQQHGLRIMVGVPWADHVAFLDDRRLSRAIRRDVMAHVRALASHPAVLMLALGNEIPAAVVRWLGPERVERFLSELYADAKAIAPDTLFTYVNYPPTEYLNLPFVDLVAFNVYLHRERDLRAYLARLQNIAGHKPLLVAEAGADSLREGVSGQAALTAMQLRASFAEGTCGAVAFAWTDEWWRGGHAINDWAFGLVDAERRPKPVLQSVADVFSSVPFSAAEPRTRVKVSVVVCAYNAAETLHECLTSLERLTYPDFEVIVVNDGSRDGTGAIARQYPSCRVIDLEHGGLSAARNAGLAAATGDIVAYTDADVRVDPDWLTYLVQPFASADVVAAGGLSLPPLDSPWIAHCVARAPGGPTHVLLDDRTAEHVPGCNLAIRRDALRAIGGFNPIYLRAGDDVDVCWRLQAAGGRIEFVPAALVWHHHRASVRAYWRQQVGYGEGQSWLVPHHRERFTGAKIAWKGHIYSPLPFVRSLSRPRVNVGIWGSAAFPSVYHMQAFSLAFLPHTVRWQIVSARLDCRGTAGGVRHRAGGGHAGRGDWPRRPRDHGVPVRPLRAGLRHRVAPEHRSPLAAREPGDLPRGHRVAAPAAAVRPGRRLPARPAVASDSGAAAFGSRPASVAGRCGAHAVPPRARHDRVAVLGGAVDRRRGAADADDRSASQLAADTHPRDRGRLADRARHPRAGLALCLARPSRPRREPWRRPIAHPDRPPLAAGGVLDRRRAGDRRLADRAPAGRHGRGVVDCRRLQPDRRPARRDRPLAHHPHVVGRAQPDCGARAGSGHAAAPDAIAVAAAAPAIERRAADPGAAVW